MKNIAPALALASSLLAGSLTASAAIVTNGDFTANASSFTADNGYDSTGHPYLDPPTDTDANPNPASPTDWTDTSNGVGAGTSSNPTPFAPSGYYSSGDPSAFVFLQGGGTSVSQTLTGLVAGDAYQLSFVSAPRSFQAYYFGNDDGSGLVTITNTTLSAGVAATTTSGTKSDNDVVDPDFTLTTVDFVATATGDSVITLANTSPDGDNTEDFSNVSITPLLTPEPTTYALMGLGLTALLLAVRNRRSLQA